MYKCFHPPKCTEIVDAPVGTNNKTPAMHCQVIRH